MKRDDEIEAVANLSFPTPEELAAALPPTVARALAEIAQGSAAGSWHGARRRTLARTLTIGAYSDCPSVAAKASDGSIVLTPFGVPCSQLSAPTGHFLDFTRAAAAPALARPFGCQVTTVRADLVGCAVA